jgi:hypothetical protein
MKSEKNAYSEDSSKNKVANKRGFASFFFAKHEKLFSHKINPKLWYKNNLLSLGRERRMDN